MNGLPPVIKRENVIYHKPIDYEKAWKYLRKLMEINDKNSLVTIMWQIENGILEIE